MYELKNGILYKNGVAVIGLGTSYFASYHPEKYPVAPDDDRIGQMKLDIKEIAEFGFNNVRTAAFEKLWWEGEEVKFKFPFIDAMVQEISKNDMSSIVRLQGYSMNHRNHPDNQPLNENGECKDLDRTFIHDCMSNKKVMIDAYKATAEQSNHFAQFNDMVGYQIYNESAFSWADHYFDYSRLSIEEHREWLVKNGYKTENQIQGYEPPRQRPNKDEDPTDWILFRLFNTEKMTEMLCTLNRAAKEVQPATESMTNMMMCPFTSHFSKMGEEYFDVAKGMDYIGLDLYNPIRGESYYYVNLILNGTESAAAVQRKHAWVVEYCCRTHMTIEDMELEAVAALGAGHKGINYYAWRSDVVGPEGGLGGLIYNDRRKTAKYDEAKKLFKVINKLSEKMAAAKKVRDGVAILYSTYANIHSDAIDRMPIAQANTLTIFTELKKLGISVDLVRAENLAVNVLDTKVLIVPCPERVPENEKRLVDEFAMSHYVFDYNFHDTIKGFKINPNCAQEINGKQLKQNWCYKPDENTLWSFRLCEVIDMCGISPKFHTTSHLDSIGFGYLENTQTEKPYAIACLSNINSFADEVKDGKLYFNGNYSKATFFARDIETELEIKTDNDKKYICLPQFKAGAFVLFE